MTRISRGWLFSIAVVAALLFQGCRYPQDVEKTLERVRGGVLDVGLTENSPWVIRTDPPSGVEVDIVREIARDLDAEVRWHWASEGELVPALKQFQLDLVIGGLVDNKRLKKQVALSKPYFNSRITVGFPIPEGEAPPATLEGVRVQVPAVNHVARTLKKEGAEPVRYDNGAPAGEPVAAATWWLRGRDLQPGHWTLRTDKHVVALPNGENAWIMHVQKHLNGIPDMAERLRRQVRASQQRNPGESEQ